MRQYVERPRRAREDPADDGAGRELRLRRDRAPRSSRSSSRRTSSSSSSRRTTSTTATTRRYPFIALTLGDPFPAIKYTREKHQAGHALLRAVHRRAGRARDHRHRAPHRARSAARPASSGSGSPREGGEPAGKPCFDYHVGLGPGPVRRRDHARGVRRERRARSPRFLDGQARRARAASSSAACARPPPTSTSSAPRATATGSRRCARSASGRRSSRRGRSTSTSSASSARRRSPACTCSPCARAACSSATSSCSTRGSTCRMAELVEGFLLRYYADGAAGPARDRRCPSCPRTPRRSRQWLTRAARRAARVRLTVPQRGEKRELLELAEDERAAHAHALQGAHALRRGAAQHRAAAARERARAAGAAAAHRVLRHLDAARPHSVGSMVVFTNGRADSKSYRRFRVRLDTGEANDVAMMGEVLRRRFAPRAHGRRTLRLAPRTS